MNKAALPGLDKACSICLEEFDTNTARKHGCGKFYHRTCINQWIQTEKKSGHIPTCPNCRQKLDEVTEPAPSLVQRHIITAEEVPEPFFFIPSGEEQIEPINPHEDEGSDQSNPDFDQHFNLVDLVDLWSLDPDTDASLFTVEYNNQTATVSYHDPEGNVFNTEFTVTRS
ncbi:hypothetical protein NX722_01260 [Endozoicomonas gorgoniicola]|uniref:RING-type domain-containing protein n=1 Tax=Endozoicomonas gorgoniicola TaxID=1234144 RepID=A0ABT3MPJ3_9GAMM|nr:RING-H2 finger protein [Endozoicomonas gorgoniicola]MCW7551289.1 hypothetical protein [Endozoicomonas gorgoniicola]